eukprot:TRINITY_DN4430_c0_g1_i1.p1 TRINITY_DN4430_c0_g1~~TRINITY_DN4430_c0_g1_i1.p1  ORF type:complete len:765 (+),score=182.52 TRINITY_DN4430_c0_g1_i1:61-2355(+)
MRSAAVLAAAAWQTAAVDTSALSDSLANDCATAATVPANVLRSSWGVTAWSGSSRLMFGMGSGGARTCSLTTEPPALLCADSGITALPASGCFLTDASPLPDSAGGGVLVVCQTSMYRCSQVSAEGAASGCSAVTWSGTRCSSVTGVANGPGGDVFLACNQGILRCELSGTAASCSAVPSVCADNVNDMVMLPDSAGGGSVVYCPSSGELTGCELVNATGFFGCVQMARPCGTLNGVAVVGGDLVLNCPYEGLRVCRLPTPAPTASPSASPSVGPTAHPSSPPSEPEPTASPTGVPTTRPSEVPTAQPSLLPTAQPSQLPTAEPSGSPTATPRLMPTGRPSRQPTGRPAVLPTGRPTQQPSSSPSGPDSSPSGSPSSSPSGSPSSSPSGSPSSSPSGSPSGEPGTPPSLPPQAPTGAPSGILNTSSPSAASSTSPPAANGSTSPPTANTSAPAAAVNTSEPSGSPTEPPTVLNTSAPTSGPSEVPSSHPTARPSHTPPTLAPAGSSDALSAPQAASLLRVWAAGGGDVAGVPLIPPADAAPVCKESLSQSLSCSLEFDTDISRLSADFAGQLQTAAAAAMRIDESRITNIVFVAGSVVGSFEVTNPDDAPAEPDVKTLPPLRPGPVPTEAQATARLLPLLSSPSGLGGWRVVRIDVDLHASGHGLRVLIGIDVTATSFLGSKLHSDSAGTRAQLAGMLRVDEAQFHAMVYDTLGGGVALTFDVLPQKGVPTDAVLADGFGMLAASGRVAASLPLLALAAVLCTA